MTKFEKLCIRATVCLAAVGVLFLFIAGVLSVACFIYMTFTQTIFGPPPFIQITMLSGLAFEVLALCAAIPLCIKTLFVLIRDSE